MLTELIKQYNQGFKYGLATGATTSVLLLAVPYFFPASSFAFYAVKILGETLLRKIAAVLCLLLTSTAIGMSIDAQFKLTPKSKSRFIAIDSPFSPNYPGKISEKIKRGEIKPIPFNLPLDDISDDEDDDLVFEPLEYEPEEGQSPPPYRLFW